MAVANAIQLTKLGIKNRDKLIKTGQYTDGPQAKNWQTCDGSMDWRTTGSLKPRKDKNGMLYYSYYNAHNPNCVKEAFSEKNNAKVSLPPSRYFQ